MYEITLVLGDWSGDGHGRTHDIHILCSVKNIDQYYASFCKENPDLLVDDGDQLLSYCLIADGHYRSYQSNIERLIEFYNKNEFYKFSKLEENPCTNFDAFEEYLGDADSTQVYVDQYLFIASYQYKKETGFDLVYNYSPEKNRIVIGGYDLFLY